MMSKAKRNGWKEARTKNGRLLFRFHTRKNLVEQKIGPVIYTIDLDDQTVSERPAKCKEGRITNLGQLAY